MKPALAIFVKTSGLSPVKTRLAADIGTSQATRFHELGAAAVAAVARAVPTLQPYWAVAENEALHMPAWSDLPTLWQGSGSLGERLARICQELQARHGQVLLVGADAPQLTATLLNTALRTLRQPRTPFVLGPARDGGFWLFGTRIPVPASVWRTPRYSTPDTAADLARALERFGTMGVLSELADIDDVNDLSALEHALESLPELLPEQTDLQRWLQMLRPAPLPTTASG